METSEQPCRQYLLRLLARREYSALELQRKAIAKGHASEAIAENLNALQAEGWQSDTRTAEAIIASGRGRYGRAGLWRRCAAKGIANEVFEAAWEATAPDRDFDAELEQVKAKAMRKYKLRDFRDLDPALKRKLIGFLQYRGFNPFEVLARWQEQ